MNAYCLAMFSDICTITTLDYSNLVNQSRNLKNATKEFFMLRVSFLRSNLSNFLTSRSLGQRVSMMVEHHESVLMRKSRVKLATSLKCTKTKSHCTRLQSRNIHFERAKINSRWLAELENG